MKKLSNSKMKLLGLVWIRLRLGIYQKNLHVFIKKQEMMDLESLLMLESKENLIMFGKHYRY